jgi:phosphatidylglycerophosphate synthase
MSTIALVLDAADGQVARRTDTVSRFGAQLDGEVDAFLILVLSIHAARRFGWWVLPGGIARYAFGVAGWKMRWMRRRLPDRRWHKWVTAIEGIALTVAAADFIPRRIATAGLVAGVVGVAASFASDTLWLWRRRRER